MTHPHNSWRWGGGGGGGEGEGRGGCLNLPLPLPFTPAPRPFHSGSLLFVSFLLRNITKWCEMFLNFSRFPPPWDSRFPPSSLPHPVPSLPHPVPFLPHPVPFLPGTHTTSGDNLSHLANCIKRRLSKTNSGKYNPSVILSCLDMKSI